MRISQTIRHNSGAVVGGIGTGSVEIRPDGLFYEWQVFNAGKWSPGSSCSSADQFTNEPDNLLFYVRTKTEHGPPQVRILGLREELLQLCKQPWLRCVQKIDFDARFPMAELTYHDEHLPIRLLCRVFSPFLPGDSQSSGTPGFYVTFSVTNDTDGPVEASILGVLGNPFGLGGDDVEPVNRLSSDGSHPMVVLASSSTNADDSGKGSLSFSLAGGETSYLQGAYRAERELVWFAWDSIYGPKPYAYMNQFREDGTLPNLQAGTRLPAASEFTLENLSHAQKRELLARLANYASVYDMKQKIQALIPDLERDETRCTEFLGDVISKLDVIKYGGWRDPVGYAPKRDCWGDAVLCSKHVLQRGETGQARFVISWHFPDHVSPAGERLGHMYENWFSDSAEANRHLRANADRHERRSAEFADMLFDTSMDGPSEEAVSGQLSTLVKCSWWLADGQFGIWEGLGCCGLRTTDITYQGSFPIIALFPDLQLSQMLDCARYQRSDGRVAHLFTPDLRTINDQFERVDMNPQFVMLVCRDYEWTGDTEYLSRMWPHVVSAMAATGSLDSDGDCLPDTGTRRSTYDSWEFKGCPSYIASVWLGALEAAARLADAVGDSSKSAEWRSMRSTGAESLKARLWNGSYFDLWNDPATGTSDGACMTDQLSGEWFAASMRWSSLLETELVSTALRSIVHHNFVPGQALYNASYPEGVPKRMPTHGNMQVVCAWSGTEYSTAALMLAHGLIDEAREVVRDIHSRYLYGGRFWNHLECGDHYYRAMSSWTLLLAHSGFRYDCNDKLIGFHPLDGGGTCRYPFFVPGAYGVYEQNEDSDTTSAVILINHGRLLLRNLHLGILSDAQAVRASVSGRQLNGSLDASTGVFRLEKDIELEEGDKLSISKPIR